MLRALCEEIDVKFDFVAKHRGGWPIETLFEAIGISRSGFYSLLRRPRNERSLADEAIGAKVFKSFVTSKWTNGTEQPGKAAIELPKDLKFLKKIFSLDELIIFNYRFGGCCADLS